MKPTLLFSGIVGVATLVGGGTTVSAQVVTEIIAIPIDNVLRAPEGSVTRVASAPVPAEFQGVACIAEAEVDNQQSEHDGNDLIVASGATSGVLENFETEAFGIRTVEIPLTLGSTLDVSVRMGPDEISSGGVFITVDCTQPVPPTTTTTDTTEPPEPGPETTAPESATPTTTVVEALPPAGGGSATPPGRPAAPSGTLPATGLSGTTWATVLATTLLGAGFGLARLARRSE